MTELTCAGIATPAYLKDKTGSIGCLLPNCEAMLLDENGGHRREGRGIHPPSKF